MNPLILEGGRILGPALLSAVRSIPPAQLAKLGLLRAPLVGVGPVSLAFALGAGVTALSIPASRKWIFEQVARAIPRPEAPIPDAPDQNGVHTSVEPVS